MLKATIKLNLIDEVFKLAHIAQSKEFDILLHHGSYTVDATSILGIMSLNLSEPIEIEAHERNEGEAVDLYGQLQREGFQIKVVNV